MNWKVIIITHGNFGKELIKSTEMLIGEQSALCSFGLHPGESVDGLRAEISNCVEKLVSENKRVIILCDVLGGSPCNIGTYIAAKFDITLVTAVSMPMIINLLEVIEETDDMREIKKVIEESHIKIIDKSFLSKED